MKNTLSLWVIGIIALLAGGIFGTYMFPTTKEVTVDKIVNVPIDVIKYQNVTVTKDVANADLFLNQTTADIFKELKHDDDFLTNEEYLYDIDEVSISDVREWSYVWSDEDEYSVTIEAKFKFKTDDERASYDVRTYKVTYEDGEDPVVELVE